MPAHPFDVTIDCADPARMAVFWGAMLGMPVTDEHGDDPGWATVGSRRGRDPRLTFQRVAEPRTGKVRQHLDVQVADMDLARARVVELGGSLGEVQHDGDEGIVVNAFDPEGHVLCLVRYRD